MIRSVLLECPRSQPRKVSRQSYIVPQERISETMCEQNGVVEVPKTSGQEGVEAFQYFPSRPNLRKDV